MIQYQKVLVMYAIIGLDNDAIINACKQAEQGEGFLQ